jgi:uncharacterized protein (DUF1778 family)
VHKRITKAAAWQGQTINGFILGAAIREADEVLSSRDRIKVTPNDANVILSLLDSNSEPNPNLKAAFKKRAEVLGE